MKTRIGILMILIVLASCRTEPKVNSPGPNKFSIVGTWQLISGTVVEKGDTVRTDYTRNTSFIKIINDTHFAFMQHDLNKGKDSAIYVSGGGNYSLTDSLYTEHLEFCSAREWEGNEFTFTIALKGDTLIQSGVEKVENTGIDRVNTEKYVKIKN